MSMNEEIRAAVLPVVPVCVPGIYHVDATDAAAAVYTTFDLTEQPSAFGDDEPTAIRYLGQLHLYLPDGQNPLALKRQLRRAMLDADFAVGAWTDASDADGQHHVLDFEGTDGEV